jgi:enamine deaminase RidA (YjgF/YER057c/UK114 family)
VLTPLVRDDVPEGLVFSLGYAIDAGSRLVFVRTSHARAAGETTGSFVAQTRASLGYVRDTLRAVDPEARLVKVRRHMTQSRELRSEAARAASTEAFGGWLSASTALQVNASCLLGSVLDVEAWAVTPQRQSAAPLERVGGGQLPEAVSVRGDQSLRVGVHLSSAGPDLPAIDHLRACLDMVDADVRTAGGGTGDLVKLTVYCPDARLWELVEREVTQRYEDHCPVLNGMVVSALLDPSSRFGVTSWSRCPAGGAASVSLGRQRTLALTGTAALDIFVGGRASDMYARPVGQTIQAQAEQVMVNQRKVLEAAGAGFEHVFRSNWYLTDLREWPVVEATARRHFDRDLPTPMVVEVPRLAAKPGVRVEPDLWASVPATDGSVLG